MAIRHTLKAYERLKREQDIDTLFRTGKAFSVFPIRFVYQLVPLKDGELSPIRVGFSIPKRKFKRAVDRNTLKRLMREAWRLNKYSLFATVPAGYQLHVFLIFTDALLQDYQLINESVRKAVEKFPSQITK